MRGKDAASGRRALAAAARAPHRHRLARIAARPARAGVGGPLRAPCIRPGRPARHRRRGRRWGWAADAADGTLPAWTTVLSWILLMGDRRRRRAAAGGRRPRAAGARRRPRSRWIRASRAGAGADATDAEAVETALATVMRATDAHEAALWRADGGRGGADGCPAVPRGRAGRARAGIPRAAGRPPVRVGRGRGAAAAHRAGQEAAAVPLGGGDAAAAGGDGGWRARAGAGLSRPGAAGRGDGRRARRPPPGHAAGPAQVAPRRPPGGSRPARHGRGDEDASRRAGPERVRGAAGRRRPRGNGRGRRGRGHGDGRGRRPRQGAARLRGFHSHGCRGVRRRRLAAGAGGEARRGAEPRRPAPRGRPPAPAHEGRAVGDGAAFRRRAAAHAGRAGHGRRGGVAPGAGALRGAGDGDRAAAGVRGAAAHAQRAALRGAGPARVHGSAHGAGQPQHLRRADWRRSPATSTATRGRSA